MNFHKNYSKQGMLPKDADEEWWIAEIPEPFSAHVFRRGAEWKWKVNDKVSLNYWSTRELAQEACVNRIKLDINKILSLL